MSELNLKTKSYLKDLAVVWPFFNITHETVKKQILNSLNVQGKSVDWFL